MAPGADDDEYRQALAEHYRRAAVGGGLVALVWMPLALARRIRRAWAAGDPWAWAAVVLTAVSTPLGQASAARRAGSRADEDLAIRARARENRRRLEAGLPVTGGLLPPGASPATCLAPLGCILTGLVLGALGRRGRPDRGRAVVGPRWRPRPGPAWWTAWSFQELPVNAGSRAPRAAQVTYERRQLLVLTATRVAAAVVPAWQRHLRPGWQERDPLRTAVGAVTVALPVVRGVADHRLVPVAVDEQRARRRRHDTAVAALVAARAAGHPGPANPWRTEMLLRAVAVTAGAVATGVQLRFLARKPEPS